MYRILIIEDDRAIAETMQRQIALWGYKLTFEHPTTHEIMAFYDAPYGSVWSLYHDELQGSGDE